MELVIVGPEQSETYNDFVATNSSGSFLQSWEWGEWQQQLGRSAIRLLVREDQKLLLAAQIIKMPLPISNKYYLYIPYGPIFDPEEARGKSFNFFLLQLNKNFPDSLFIRMEPKNELPTTNYQLRTTSHIQPGKTLVLDLRQTENNLLAAMHHKTRYNIKVAQRHGIKVESELIVTPGQGLLLPEVVHLIVNTAGRQKYKTFPANYYRELINFFGMRNKTACKLTIYKALSEKELLAAAIMIDFGSTRTYLFGGTSEQKKNLMAPYALHWQAILDAKNRGLKNYDFWGIETSGGKTPGFVRFKQGWGGKTLSYPTAVDLIKSQLWYTGYRISRSVNKLFNV